MKNLAPTLSTNDALILQSLGETGEEEVNDIAKELSEPRGRIVHQLAVLKRKGLIRIINKYGEPIISLTTKGRRAISYIWPEAYAY